MKLNKRISLFLLILWSVFSAQAQYFGQNKVNYEKFNFVVNHTPHFTIHNYLGNDSLIKQISNQAEKWYLRHNAIFLDTITENPLILYNDKADFKQTDIISGEIGVGTGGVTEGLKRRVIMPYMSSNKETNHVLGHELVHVFQYHLFQKSDSLTYKHLANVPLWMIEGLAEYMSLGTQHNQTAMWMRDAVIHDDVPTFRDMSRRPNKYFPYRFGHAFWAYITGKYGDGAIRPLFYNTARFGFETAIDTLFNIKQDSLAKLWQQDLKTAYQPFIKDSVKKIGRQIVDIEKHGKLNLSPVLSPDGKKVSFLSNRAVFTIDLLIANVKNGKIIDKITQSVSKSHVDDFNYIESSGSWSPDGKKYVLTSFSKGKNLLTVVNFKRFRNKSKDLPVKGVDSFDNPEWSPDGKYVVFSGLNGGVSDLYLYEFATKKTIRLTHDAYSDMQPTWSEDSQKILFISDRGYQTNFSRQIFGNYRLCEYNLQDGKIKTYHNLFPHANIYNPIYAKNDSVIYFVSNADGYRNLYEYDTQHQKLYRLTKYNTGISGITALSPAFSISRKANKIAYTYYDNKGYNLYIADLKDFKKEEVSLYLRDEKPEMLAPFDRKKNVIQHNLNKHPQTSDSSITQTPYKPTFELEYIGNTGGIGVGVGGGYNDTYASGGVFAIFSDMLKKHQLFTSLMMQGEIYDIGGSATYINNNHRLKWGVGIGHTPYRYAYYEYNNSMFDPDPFDSITIVQQRIFLDRASVFAHYPLSKKLRFEAGANISRYGYRVDYIKNYYYNGYYQGMKKERGESPDSFWLNRIQVAFVGDDTHFGFTSPLAGYRYRFQVERALWGVDMYTTIADVRRFIYKRPFSFGVRLLNYARYGKDAETNRLYPLYLGSHYFVRGYSGGSFAADYDPLSSALNYNTLVGTKMLMFNTEVKVPFTGHERLALIKSNFLYTDLVLFFDGGFCAKSYDNINFNWKPKQVTNLDSDVANVVYSAGIAWRINLFGYIILEPYFARPFQRDDRKWVFGLFLKGMDW